MDWLPEIQLGIECLTKIVVLVEKVDPNAANNPIVIDLLKALERLKNLGQ